MKRLYALLLSLVATSVPLAPAQAQDLAPPDYRSAPRSTVAGWDLVDDQGSVPIRPYANVPLWIGDAAGLLEEKFPAHAPFPSAFLSGDIRHTQDAGGGYLGGSSGNGAMIFVVPGWLETFPIQRLRVQVGFQGPEPHVLMEGYAGIPGSPGTIKAFPTDRVPVQDESLPPQRKFFFEDWVMMPSPTWNQVTLFVPPETIIFHVVIDTVVGTDPIFDDDYEDGDF